MDIWFAEPDGSDEEAGPYESRLDYELDHLELVLEPVRRVTVLV